ncbi:MAG: GntR family transcriptional regulator [Victivallales bacterium]|nr:GntR family transcriptional regulator [Victivallales bacterium]
MPASQQMYEELRRQLESRQLLPGMQLPSESELCAQYSISRPTVRRVLGRLCDMGLLVKRPGIGTFVSGGEGESRQARPADFHIGLDCMVSAGIYQFYYGEILKGIWQSPDGSNCMFSPLPSENLSESDIGECVDALLLLKNHKLPSRVRSLLCARRPVLLFNQCDTAPEPAYLTVDHRRESEHAVAQLLEQGCDAIVLAGDLPDDSPYVPLLHRVRGWEDAYRHAGLAVPKHLRLPMDALVRRPDEVASFLRGSVFSGVFFVDAMAMVRFYHIYLQCRRTRMDSFSLVCFDDLDLVPLFDGLKCRFLRMPLRQMGAMALDYLRRKRADPDYPVLRRFVPCSMITRQSSFE